MATRTRSDDFPILTGLLDLVSFYSYLRPLLLPIQFDSNTLLLTFYNVLLHPTTVSTPSCLYVKTYFIFGLTAPLLVLNQLASIRKTFWLRSAQDKGQAEHRKGDRNHSDCARSYAAGPEYMD